MVGGDIRYLYSDSDPPYSDYLYSDYSDYLYLDVSLGVNAVFLGAGYKIMILDTVLDTPTHLSFANKVHAFHLQYIYTRAAATGKFVKHKRAEIAEPLT